MFQTSICVIVICAYQPATIDGAGERVAAADAKTNEDTATSNDAVKPARTANPLHTTAPGNDELLDKVDKMLQETDNLQDSTEDKEKSYDAKPIVVHTGDPDLRRDPITINLSIRI